MLVNMADKLSALQARLGTKFNVAGKAGRTQVLLEGMLFLAQASSPLHANPREAFLTDDALLLIKQESMSRLAVQEIPLSGLYMQDRLSSQIPGLSSDPTAAHPWSFALAARPGASLTGDFSLPIVLAAADKDSKELWLEHLGGAVAELLPGELRLAPCWYHRFVVAGTLFSAAAADDAELAAALIQASPSARGRGVSSLPFDEKSLPELDLDALEPAVAGGSGGTALHIAARAGSVRVLRALLEGGASMAVQDGDLASPLHVALEASSHASLAAAAVLIANEAPFDARNLLDVTPLHVALGRLAVEASAPPSSSCAATSAAAGDVPAASLASAIADTVALMLQHGACPRTADADGLEPLHRLLTSPAAAAAGGCKLLSALVRAGADANAPVMLPDPAEAARSSGFGFGGAGGAGDAAAGAVPTAAPSLSTGRPAGEVAAPIHLALGIGAVWARAMTAATAAGSLSPSPVAPAAAVAVPAAAVAPGFAGAAASVLAAGAPLLSQSVIAELLQLGAHPNARTLPGGETPLHLLLRILAAARAVGPDAGANAAHIAAQAAEADACIGRLVAAGARADIADASGATAAALADALGLRPVLDSAVARYAPAFAARAPPPAAATRVGTLGTLHKRWRAPEGELVAARRSRLGALTAASSRPVGMALEAKHWAGDAAGGSSSSSEGNACVPCGAGFTLLRRKHHCRHCGVLVCDKCSGKRFPLAAGTGGGGADSDDDAGGKGGLSFGIPGMRVAGARGAGAGGTGAGGAAGAGGDGPATTEERVCDGCFNRLCAAVEDADRRAAAWEKEKAAALAQAPGRIAAAAAATAAGGASGPVRTAAATGGAGSGAGAAARPLPTAAPPPDAARAALFGGRTAAAPAAAAAPGSAAAVGTQAGHVGEVLSQARDRLVERGHRLANIEDRSAKMADSAASFADAAAAMKKQAKGSSGIAGWFGL